MSRVVVILGPHRSGTSLVAGMLQFMGVRMGERLMPANEFNPLGYFENWDFVMLNDLILTSAGGSWGNPPPRRKILEVGKHYEEAIKAVIRRNAREPLWGWKDPRTCLTVELYHPHLGDPLYVIVERDVNDIAKSLVKREGMPLREAVRLTEEYVNRITTFLDAYRPNYVVVRYENVKEDIHRVAEALGIKVTRKALRLIKPKWKLRLARAVVRAYRLTQSIMRYL